mmetsp:Transcript_67816/g.172138  ORF Transcript_67816/g.172138 Transcript_67816/m.172138 type:complete len:222 (-) Transcript_67816:147-812(-)
MIRRPRDLLVVTALILLVLLLDPTELHQDLEFHICDRDQDEEQRAHRVCEVDLRQTVFQLYQTIRVALALLTSGWIAAMNASFNFALLCSRQVGEALQPIKRCRVAPANGAIPRPRHRLPEAHGPSAGIPIEPPCGRCQWVVGAWFGARGLEPLLQEAHVDEWEERHEDLDIRHDGRQLVAKLLLVAEVLELHELRCDVGPDEAADLDHGHGGVCTPCFPR